MQLGPFIEKMNTKHGPSYVIENFVDDYKTYWDRSQNPEKNRVNLDELTTPKDQIRNFKSLR